MRACLFICKYESAITMYAYMHVLYCAFKHLRRMELISGTEPKTNEKVLKEVEEKRSSMDIIRTRQKNWVGHVGIQYVYMFMLCINRSWEMHENKFRRSSMQYDCIAVSALPNAMIFSSLALGPPWPTLGHLLLLVHHFGITSLLFVRLFCLLPFSRLSLSP